MCLIFLQCFIWNIWLWRKILFEHAVMLKTSGGRGVKKWSCARPVSPKISLGFCSVSPPDRFPLLWMGSGFAVFHRRWAISLKPQMKALGKHINGKHGETEPKTILLFLFLGWGGEELKRDGDVAKAIQCGADMKEQSLIEYYTHTAIDTPIWGHNQLILLDGLLIIIFSENRISYNNNFLIFPIQTCES